MKTIKNMVKKVAVASMLLSLGTGSLSTLQTDTAAHVSAASLQQVSKTGLITNKSGLNVRTGASTSHKRIGGVYKNDRVQIVGQQGDWYKIKFGNGFGFINNLGVQIISNTPALTPMNKTGLITNKSGLNVRSGPSTSHSRIGGVYQNNRVQIVGQQGDWYKIKFGNGFGFINNLGVQIVSGPTPQPPVASITPTSYVNIDLRKPSKVSAQRINEYIKKNKPNSLLVGYGDVFLQAQDKYGVNAGYLVAHAMLESTWGTSYLARTKNNIYGQNAVDWNPNAAYGYKSLKESIMYQGYAVRKYWLEPTGNRYNGPTLVGMNKTYASDKQWANKIAQVMNEFYAFNSNDYR